MRRHAGGSSREIVTFSTRSVQETPSRLLLQEDDDSHSGWSGRGGGKTRLEARVYLPSMPAGAGSSAPARPPPPLPVPFC